MEILQQIGWVESLYLVSSCCFCVISLCEIFVCAFITLFSNYEVKSSYSSSSSLESHLSTPLGRQTSSPPTEWWWTRPEEKPFYKPSFCYYHHKEAQKCDYRHQLLGGPVVVEWEEPMTRFEVVARIAGQCWLERENIVEYVEELRFLVSTIAIKMKILRPLRNLLRDTYHSRTDLSTHGQRLLRAGYRPAIWFYGFSKSSTKNVVIS